MYIPSNFILRGSLKLGLVVFDNPAELVLDMGPMGISVKCGVGRRGEKLHETAPLCIAPVGAAVDDESEWILMPRRRHAVRLHRAGRVPMCLLRREAQQSCFLRCVDVRIEVDGK